ncbi:hypothetical protein ACH4F6_05985 [Streptomyces sp. NPDC017936]|uniref:hypothetical protein n=1 Tax=Streptomyces sp. NPDC017936 TaxID=3365016 RepID=UPI0037A2AFED
MVGSYDRAGPASSGARDDGRPGGPASSTCRSPPDTDSRFSNGSGRGVRATAPSSSLARTGWTGWTGWTGCRGSLVVDRLVRGPCGARRPPVVAERFGRHRRL